jgi:peptidoglycan/LPS O-acetylase OafA/YrhL
VIEAADLPAVERQAPNLTPPPGNPRFPLFDAARAIAALSVFAGHTVTDVYAFATHRTLFVWASTVAYQGVAIFFVISGFLLYRPFLVARRGGPALGVPAYARRRFLRIVPAYWAALTILVAAGLIGGVSAHNWWVFYGFGQIYSATAIGQGIGVAWTLCIEVTFYALLPLFALVAGGLGRGSRSLAPDVALLILLSGASLAFRAHYSSVFDAEKVSTLAGTFTWFALGMALAIGSVVSERATGPKLSRAWRRWWPAASWCLAGLLFVALHEISVRPTALGYSATSVVVHVLYGVTAVCILLPAAFGQTDPGPVGTLLRSRALAFVGLVSYALYLYHSTVITRMAGVIGGGGTWWRYPAVAAVALVMSLVFAAASYYGLERPLMLLGRRWPGRGRPARRVRR